MAENKADKMVRKILICDDNESIHEDFRFTLSPPKSGADKKNITEKISNLLGELDDENQDSANEMRSSDALGNQPEYELHFARQGEEAMLKVIEAETKSDPFSLIFMDVRMPPGIDGIQTVKLLRNDYPHLEFVICTAFSDYSWEQIAQELGETDKVLFLPKPFDPTAVKQIALSQTTKFNLMRKNKAYSEKLEEMVENRTQALEQKLSEIKEMQRTIVNQEKLASLGTLTAGIAHELKNPLHFVSNFSDSVTELAKEIAEVLSKIKDSSLSESDVQLLMENMDLLVNTTNKIKEHTNRADSIIKNMLMHTRGETNDAENLNVNDIIEKYADLSYISAKSLYKNFNCKINISKDTAIQSCNIVKQDLGRVFINLLSNAFYALNEKWSENPNFNPVVSITSKHEGDFFSIVIQDNGPGIDETKQKHIFEPFYTTKPTGVGTGLGLSISHEVVAEEHGGSLICESVVGEFTKFIVQIPYNTGIELTG